MSRLDNYPAACLLLAAKAIGRRRHTTNGGVVRDHASEIFAPQWAGEAFWKRKIPNLSYWNLAYSPSQESLGAGALSDMRETGRQSHVLTYNIWGKRLGKQLRSSVPELSVPLVQSSVANVSFMNIIFWED